MKLLELKELMEWFEEIEKGLIFGFIRSKFI